MFGEQLYRLPDMEVDIKGLKVQRAGLHIGEFKKQRFEPSHSLALALKLSEAKNVVKLTWDDPQTTGFFNGQSVMLSDEQTAECKKGWALVCVAVSYTHLDVYKRQILSLSSSTMSRSEIAFSLR